MFKLKSCMEVEIVGRKYELYCSPDSPLEHAKEAVFQFSKYLGQIEDNARAQLNSKEEVEDSSNQSVDQPDSTENMTS